jgi:hypothetical protein
MGRGLEHRRRLNAAAAVRDGVRALPRLWAGAWGVLLFATLLGLAAPWVPAGMGRVAYGFALGLTALAAWGALCRISVGKTPEGARRLGLRPGGLQFGALETRIAAAAFLNLLFLSMILVVLALVTLAVFGIAELDVAAIQARDWANAGPAWKLAMLAIVGLIAVGVPLLLSVRLALFSQATTGRGHTVSLNTMGVAHGSFWPLLAVILLSVLPLLLLGAACLGGLSGLCQPAGLALVLPWLQAPWAAALLGAAYDQIEYWKPA